METATVQTFPEVVADLFELASVPVYTGMSEWKSTDANGYGREATKRHDWAVKIKRADGAGSVMTIEYHTGTAHAARIWFDSQMQYSMRIGQWVPRRIADVKSGGNPRCYIADQNDNAPVYITGVHGLKIRDGGDFVTIPQPPKIEDVVYSILSDVQSYEQSPNFSDWCADYGYSDDSISALETFQAVQREALDWYRHFRLTPAEIERLAYAMSDY